MTVSDIDSCSMWQNSRWWNLSVQVIRRRLWVWRGGHMWVIYWGIVRGSWQIRLMEHLLASLWSSLLVLRSDNGWRHVEVPDWDYLCRHRGGQCGSCSSGGGGGWGGDSGAGDGGGLGWWWWWSRVSHHTHLTIANEAPCKSNVNLSLPDECGNWLTKKSLVLLNYLPCK